MARACGSYPQCPRFKSRCRYQNPKDGAAVFWDFPFSGSTPLGQPGPLVKWLRHRPFTAVTRVRVSYGSPIWRRSSAGRALASHARGHRFEFCRLHQKKSCSLNGYRIFCTIFLLSPVSFFNCLLGQTIGTSGHSWGHRFFSEFME